jgi:hypothetical protein
MARDLACILEFPGFLTFGKHVLCKRAGLIGLSLCTLSCRLQAMLSPDVVCSCPGNKNKEVMKTKFEVSVNLGCVNSLTNSCVQNSPENQLAIVSAKKGVSYICQGLSYGDEFWGGERIDSCPANYLTHIKKTPERLFQQQSISRPARNRPQCRCNLQL